MKKGFTLVELLGVIVLLGVLTLVMFPILLNQINKSKQGINDATSTMIYEAAKDYMNDNQNTYPKKENISYCIPLVTLVTNNYLSETIKDENMDNINLSKKVKVTTNNSYKFELLDECTNNSYEQSNISVPIVTNNTTESGLYEAIGEPGRYIYRGKNPNNYITLKEGNTNVTYRIISYEADGTIKVIRDTSIGNYAWDERTDTTTGPRKNIDNSYCNYSGEYYGCNVWGNTSNTYYNGELLASTFMYKYYSSNSVTSLTNSTNTGTVTQDASLNTYLNSEWLRETKLSDYIDTHNFNVGGIYYTYPQVGGDKGLIKEKEEQNLYIWKGKIGLMNATEYVEASLNPTCTSVYSNFYYNTNYYYDTDSDGTEEQTITQQNDWPCSNKNYNWLVKDITEWTLTAQSKNRYITYFIYNTGSISQYSNYGTRYTRPVFYLKSSVVLTGSGTSSDPYKIK